MTEEELKEYLYILCGRNDIYIEECYAGYPQKEIEDKKWVQFESAVNKLILKNEELEKENLILREIVMIKKMAIPYKEIKDKSLYDLYDMPSYIDLVEENQELKEIIAKTITTLVNINGDLAYGKKSDKICNLIDTLRLVI